MRNAWRFVRTRHKNNEQLALLVLTECHIVPDYLTFIDDYLMAVEFIDWLKDFYLGKAKLLM